VTAAVAVPASAGIPVTHRRYASAFAVVTGHQCDGASDLDWGALARLPALVILMGLRALPEIVGRLLAHGARPDTPAAVIANGTLDEERTVVGTLASIAAQAAEAALEPPATVVVGEIVRVRERLGNPCTVPRGVGGGGAEPERGSGNAERGTEMKGRLRPDVALDVPRSAFRVPRLHQAPAPPRHRSLAGGETQ
jgi:hypothetical protein